MDVDERFANLCLALGMALGSLRDPAVSERLIEALKTGRLHRPYVEALRNGLDEILKAVPEPRG